jgi:hypothetical protein
MSNFYLKIPASDIKGFLAQLQCKPTQRNHYVDWGNANTLLLEKLLDKPITAPLSPETVIDYAVAVGKDITEGGWFYFNTGQIEQTDTCGSIHYAGGRIHSKADLIAEKFRSLESQFEHLEQVCRLAVKHNIGIHVDVQSFFTEVYLAMGYEQFFTALYDNISFIEYFLDLALEKYIEIIQRLVKYPISMVLIDSDLCDATGVMINPTMLEKIWYQRMKKMLQPFHEANIPIVFHCDGKLDKVLDLFISLGACAIHPIEPKFNDIYDIYSKYKGKICLIGNIEIESVLVRGTPEIVRRDVLEHLNQLGKNGGYILATSTSYFPKSLSPDNFFSMLKAVYGY